METILDKAKKIKLVIFDVDGILTSGLLSYSKTGIETKNFHVHDGQGIKLLKQSGIAVGIITTCASDLIRQRINDLGIEYFYPHQIDKLPAYDDLKQKLKLENTEIAYMGDDLPDLPILRRVGLAITVPNAPAIIKKYAHWVTELKGGKGAAREVCDTIMQAQGTYQSIISPYLI